jgi:hypothetical protein
MKCSRNVFKFHLLVNLRHKIEDYSFSGSKEMKNIYFEFNMIEEIRQRPVTVFENLKNLFIWFKTWKNFNTVIQYDLNYREREILGIWNELVLWYNSIHSYIKYDVFSHVINLDKLDLRNNFIENVTMGSVNVSNLVKLLESNILVISPK